MRIFPLHDGGFLKWNSKNGILISFLAKVKILHGL